MSVVRVLLAYEGAPWLWGRSDCLCLAADVAAAASGSRTPLDTPRGAYASRAEAAAVLRGLGYRRLADLAHDALTGAGWQVVAPEASAVGDVGATRTGALCVRAACGFVARDRYGAYRHVTAERAWTCRK